MSREKRIPDNEKEKSKEKGIKSYGRYKSPGEKKGKIKKKTTKRRRRKD